MAVDGEDRSLPDGPTTSVLRTCSVHWRYLEVTQFRPRWFSSFRRRLGSRSSVNGVHRVEHSVLGTGPTVY